jgi:hypothetical protein
MPYQPVRYVVTNTKQIILVTHDYRFALKISTAINNAENPTRYFVRVK